MRVRAFGGFLAVGFVAVRLVSAEQVSLQPKVNGYAGYTHAEMQGVGGAGDRSNNNATTLWELHANNCIT